MSDATRPALCAAPLGLTLSTNTGLSPDTCKRGFTTITSNATLCYTRATTHLHPVSILVLVYGQLQRLGRILEVPGRRRHQRLRPPRTRAIHLTGWPRWRPELARTLPMVVMQVERRRPQLRVLGRRVVAGIGQSMWYSSISKSIRFEQAVRVSYRHRVRWIGRERERQIDRYRQG